MSLNYTTFVSQYSNLLVIGSTDPNFTIMLPGAIDYAEQRIYRELDLVNTTVIDTTTTFSSGNRFLTLPSTWVVIEEVNTFSSAGTTSSNGSRNPLIETSREFINYAYPSNSTATGIPAYWNLLSQTQIIVGPTPDASYSVEIIGTQRPVPLSAANSSTFLTAYLPDLFMAAAMVYGAGWMRDFGSQSDNPQMSQSWENQYNLLFKSATTEEMRKKWQAEGWTSESPSPIATPKRV